MLIRSGVRRAVPAPVIVIMVLAFVALFALSALLPGQFLIIALTVLLFASFGYVAWRTRGE
jgi:hypothetical protein